jgi:hypothetical protein
LIIGYFIDLEKEKEKKGGRKGEKVTGMLRSNQQNLTFSHCLLEALMTLDSTA